MSSAKQWGRQCRLTVAVGNDTPEAIDFSDFRIRFQVKQTLTGQPGTAEIYVYNVSRETERKLSEEGQEVILEAGYPGNMGVIFRGQLRQRMIGRESPTDTYLRIVAASGDQAHVYGVVNVTLAAGSSPDDVYQAIGDPLKYYGMSLGYVPKLPGSKLPRGKVMYGMARDHLRDFCDTYQLRFGYDGDQLVCVPKDGAIPEEAIEINVNTGMIGMPIMTMGGLDIACLLNPELSIGRTIHIDNDSIQFEAISTAYGADPENVFKSKKMQGANGYYTILSREHLGDTRGNYWYTNLICEGVDAELSPITGAKYNAVEN